MIREHSLLSSWQFSWDLNREASFSAILLMPRKQIRQQTVFLIYARRNLPSTRPLVSRSCPTNTEKVPPVEFRNVSFVYASRRNYNVLHDLNLKIQKGESVGVIGASGCGKSTIVALLERFYDVNLGQILIEGTSLTSLDVRHNRSHIGLVSQDTMLFQGSLRDNILFGLPDDKASAPDAIERIERACRSVNMYDFIVSLPEGYSTDVANCRVALSGGQRQRLAIARHWPANRLLLFDEATSALDTANEALVQQAIESVTHQQPDRTTIAVAHRLSTIRRCDHIFGCMPGKWWRRGLMS